MKLPRAVRVYLRSVSASGSDTLTLNVIMESIIAFGCWGWNGAVVVLLAAKTLCVWLIVLTMQQVSE